MAVSAGFPLYRDTRDMSRMTSSSGSKRAIGWFVQQVNADRLVRDLDVLATDMEKLVQASADNANEAMVDARERIESVLGTARQNLEKARLCAIEGAKSAAQSADDYLRDNVWKAVGLAGGIGFLLGAIVSRRSAPSRMPRE